MSGRASGEGVVCVGGRRGGGVPGWGAASSSRGAAVGRRAAIRVDGAAAVGVGIYGSRPIAAGVIGRCATTTVGAHCVLAPHGSPGCRGVGGPGWRWQTLVRERKKGVWDILRADEPPAPHAGVRPPVAIGTGVRPPCHWGSLPGVAPPILPA